MDDEAVYRIDKDILEEKFKEKLIPRPKAVNLSVDEVSYNKIKRLNYGYKDVDYFKLKIHQHCGLLNPRLLP